MSVRRLALEQPAAFAFTPENQAWCEGEIAKYPKGREASAIIALLWRAQAQHECWLPKAAIETVAGMLHMPAIRVLEIATFYSMFNLAPVGKYFIQLCGTTPRMLCGAGELRAVLEARIGGQKTVSRDGLFSWSEVECLGACSNAPMVQINDDYYEDLSTASLNRLMDDLAAGRPVKKGSQTGRVSSEPMPGPITTLTDPKLYDGSVVGAWKSRFDAVAAPAAPAPAPAPPPMPAPAAVIAEKESAAQAEETEINAMLATLAPGASATDKANAVGVKPAPLAAARGGVADDLKRVSGIGRVNEGKLNALGIFHFDQIAAWLREEIRWVGTYLAFPGRIDRENWVAQAALLAKGGDTEFSKRVDKGEVTTSAGGRVSSADPARPDKVK